MRYLRFLLILPVFVVSACQDSAPSAPPHEPGQLVSSTQTTQYSYQQLRTVAALLGFDDFTAILNHDVRVYRIVYRTSYRGDVTEASGLLFVPQNVQGGAPLVSLQHGTTFRKDDAPSVAGEFSGVELFASAGYVALMPDYLGYGASSSIFHPYYDREHSASAVTDMILAVGAFAGQEGIALDGRVFLAGYSEGGYTTMAAAHAMENGAIPDYSLTAVAAGAGGYDLPHMLNTILEGETYDYPAYIAFLVKAYNETYSWNRPLTDFFADEYAAVLSERLNGDYDDGDINPLLTNNIHELFNPDFLAALEDPEGELEFKGALEMNAVSAWHATTPIRLYHGTADIVVPYSNSERTLESMLNAGSEEVSLISIPGGTHGSSLVPMLALAVPWFEEIRQQ
ncbi:MAG: alpha/beta fold hydrolase [Bacteroidota bacterium]|jgi:pimeloyl-ACP methyl ester carboxylesterase